MLFYPPQKSRLFTVDNWEPPDAGPGTSITPGNGSKGSYTQLLSATAQEAHAFMLRVSDQSGDFTARPLLLDIGVDPAGGTSYSNIVTDLVTGSTPSIGFITGGNDFLFPLRIPAGATVAARGQSNSTGALWVGIKAYSSRFLPSGFPVGQLSETVGNTAITPGNGSYGSWTSLGTNTNPFFWVQMGLECIHTGASTAEDHLFQLAYGDGSNKHVLMTEYLVYRSDIDSCAMIQGQNANVFNCYHRIQAGVTFYVRGWADGAVNTTYTANVVGVCG